MEEVYEQVKKVKDFSELGEQMGWILARRGHEKGRVARPERRRLLHDAEGGWRDTGPLPALLHVGGVDCTDVRDLTFAEIESRRQVAIAWKFIKKYMPGFEKAYVSRICPELRIRETRRIMGDYMLTSDDVVQARKFDDVIGKSSFPKGGHHTTKIETLTLDANHEYPKDGGSHDIPYRCLVPKNTENLLVAGKAISTDRDAYHRFLQQTIVTGQAAGTAAALCAKTGITPRQLEKDVKKLQDALLTQGVILTGTH